MKFPVFIDSAQLKALIIGGGEAALRKASSLLNSGADIVCCSEDYKESFIELFTKHDAAPELIFARIESFDEVKKLIERYDINLLVMATNDRDLNHELARKAASKGILVLDVSGPYGNIEFGSVWRNGPVTFAVHSGGAPSLSASIREKAQSKFSDEWGEQAAEFIAVRKQIKNKQKFQSELKLRANYLADTLFGCDEERKRDRIDELFSEDAETRSRNFKAEARPTIKVGENQQENHEKTHK